MLRDTKLLNKEINYMLSSMMHTDMLIITDAGCPIPEDSWEIDLSITRNIPKLVTVLEVISEVFITEKIIYAENVPTHNEPYFKELKDLFNDCNHETVSQEDFLKNVIPKAKAYIRTGDYNPWGNIALISGTDPDNWFYSEDVKIPESYIERREQVRKKTINFNSHKA